MTLEENRKRRQQEEEQSFREFASEQIGLLNILTTEKGFEERDAIEFMKYLMLKEISDALFADDNDGFASSLYSISVSLEALTQCISVDRGSSFLSITGNIDTCQL